MAATQACSPSASKPTVVTLAQLAAQQEHYTGKEVSIAGRVQAFTDSGGTYYALTDDEENRVALEPADDAAAYSGEEVRVRGRFRFDPDKGRRIEVKSIVRDRSRPTTDPTAATSDV